MEYLLHLRLAALTMVFHTMGDSVDWKNLSLLSTFLYSFNLQNLNKTSICIIEVSRENAFLSRFMVTWSLPRVKNAGHRRCLFSITCFILIKKQEYNSQNRKLLPELGMRPKSNLSLFSDLSEISHPKKCGSCSLLEGKLIIFFYLFVF